MIYMPRGPDPASLIAWKQKKRIKRRDGGNLLDDLDNSTKAIMCLAILLLWIGYMNGYMNERRYIRRWLKCGKMP
jgi:hypothetical protein